MSAMERPTCGALPGGASGPRQLGAELKSGGPMERTGIEPVTPCLQSRCSPN